MEPNTYFAISAKRRLNDSILEMEKNDGIAKEYGYGSMKFQPMRSSETNSANTI